jgi:hypothetical protein
MLGATRLIFLGVFTALWVLLLASSPTTASYVFNYEIHFEEPTSGSTNVNISANPDSLFITDVIDQYHGKVWEIIDAVETPDGRIETQVTVDNLEGGSGASTLHSLSVSFEILSQDGSQTAEPVVVDAWGAVQLNYDAVEQYPLTTVCCGSELMFEASFFNAYGIYASYSPAAARFEGEGGHTIGSDNDIFFGSYELLTNTTYYLYYHSWLYVETALEGISFASRDGYDAFVDLHGLFGTVYHQVDGFFQFGMVLHPVPEPSALVLFGAGMAGLILIRRRTIRSNCLTSR